MGGAALPARRDLLMSARPEEPAAEQWVGADEARRDRASPLNPVFYGPLRGQDAGGD